MSNAVQELGRAISTTMNKRIADEARAKRGTIRNGWFYSGNDTYPARIAIDGNFYNGAKGYAQITPNGKAVIVGA